MIACVGWGSLVWDPRQLPVQDKWFEDGPLIRVEFARQSSDGRLTLVLLRTGSEVRSLWAPFSGGTVADARRELGNRESLPERNHERHIAVWSAADSRDLEPASIGIWAKGLGLEAAVWTALPPRFRDEDERIPTVEEAVQYLRDLQHEKRRNAERYVRMAPRQVDTLYRRRFELEFGWTPLAP